jgi:hypothetical protein
MADVSKEWQELLDFMALPKSEQFKIGRSMRTQATKGDVAEIPKCIRCKRISVLSPCRKCASDKELAALPPLP